MNWYILIKRSVGTEYQQEYSRKKSELRKEMSLGEQYKLGFNVKTWKAFTSNQSSSQCRIHILICTKVCVSRHWRNLSTSTIVGRTQPLFPPAPSTLSAPS